MTEDRKNNALYDIAKFFEKYDKDKFLEEYKKRFTDPEDFNLMSVALDRIIRSSKLFLDGRLGEQDTARSYEENLGPFEAGVAAAVEGMNIGNLDFGPFITFCVRFINIVEDEREIDRPGGGLFN